MSERQQALQKWVVKALSSIQGQSVVSADITMIAGDASFRSYYRVTSGAQTFVLMDAPPEHEDCLPFVKIASAWIEADIRVPRILAQDVDLGFLLLEDFGDHLLGIGLNAETVEDRYGLAMQELHRIQSMSAQDLPLYDAALLTREMSLFRDWFLSSWLQINLNSQEEALLTEVETKLIQSALQQPQVVVHRDFHSRNLMLLPEWRIGVIDFQDAVIGGATYDLVSLLRDSYVHWPETKVATWVRDFHRHSPWSDDCSYEDFKQYFDWMGMQRQLKVCGIFVRLCQRDGKAAYLQDIPLTFRNLLQSAARYPEFVDFYHWLEQRVRPELIKRPELSTLSADFWTVS